MIKNYHKATILLALGAATLSLSACGNNRSTTETTATTTASSATTAAASATSAPSNGAAKMADTYTSPLPDSAPTYKVVTTGTMPPFSYIDEKGGLMGYDIDAMRAIAEAGGFKVEFYKNPWQGLFDPVESGKYDMAASGISYTEERSTRYKLSDSYFFNPSAIMYKANGKPLKTLADLKGMRVAGMTGSKQIDQYKAATGATEAGGYDTTYLLFQALVQGKQDAIVQDEPFLRYTAKNFPNEKVVIVPYEGQSEPSAQQIVLMKKGNEALAAKVNKGIAAAKVSGKLKAIEDKWLGAK